MTGSNEKDLSNLITVIARFTTKGDPKEFERFFLEHVEYMRAQEGFGAHQAVTLSENPSVYVNFGWWTSKDAFQKVVRSEQFRAHQGVMHSMLDGAELDLCKNLFRVNAADSAGKREDFDKPLMNITVFQVDGDEQRFEEAFAAHAEHVKSLHGFGYADLNKSLQKPGRYTGIGYWWDPAAYPTATAHPTYQALAELADVTVERVEHLAWNRAPGAEDDRQ
ncbi:antibiotic biosynthesis monooxygenase [Streptomyces chengbuensis]|uniref:antibiotic biosynthesis monooxygenase family protein n=1 Tax=Streptomyces TaxID=1883 RepID=UPI0025B35A46|nr:antibiotic biosynthesis monooxygenase [Streptomyces sp. HUAS CB01]WJY50974.1 antibiotic biosynthesis monooxygenase [Streptomyces sp. HUAS CB01]